MAHGILLRVRRPSASAARGFAIVAAVTALAVMVGTGIVGTPAFAADDYATWAEVQKAKASVADKTRLIEKIQGTLVTLQKNVDDTQADAQRLGDAAQVADQKYQEQALKTQQLQSQADAAEQAAATSKKQAGIIASQQYRSSDSDVSVNLFLNGDDSENMLWAMGMSQKLGDQSKDVFADALLKQNTAQSLSDQASVAQTELKKLKAAADDALDVASAAADKAAAALVTQQANVDQQQELLDELKTSASTTEQSYNKGVAARAAARAAALAAAAAKSYGPNVSTASPHLVGEWALPAYGRITDGFGYRVNPWGGRGMDFHLGTDIGAACGSHIYAAHAGKVSYSGWNGIYGNFIRIDIGGGVQNEYGHILMGGLKVSRGETVQAGQLIALVGKTGGATGCHLHFGVRINGLVTNPVPFMRSQGIELG